MLFDGYTTSKYLKIRLSKKMKYDLFQMVKKDRAKNEFVNLSEN